MNKLKNHRDYAGSGFVRYKPSNPKFTSKLRRAAIARKYYDKLSNPKTKPSERLRCKVWLSRNGYNPNIQPHKNIPLKKGKRKRFKPVAQKKVYTRDRDATAERYKFILIDPLEPLAKKRYCKKWLEDNGYDHPDIVKPYADKHPR